MSEKQEVSDDALKVMGTALAKEVDVINLELLTKAYKVKLRYTAKGDKDKEVFEDEKYIAKYNGYWYFVSHNPESGSGYFDNP